MPKFIELMVFMKKIDEDNTKPYEDDTLNSLIMQGKDEDEEYIVRPVHFNIDSIESYGRLYGNEGKILKEKCLVTLRSGVEICVNLSFKELNNILNAV